MPNDNNQKNILLFKKNRIVVKTNNARIHVLTFFSDPILSSTLPRTKHPNIPKRLMKIPKNNNSFSEKENRKLANIEAKAKIQITALLKKK